MAFYDPTILGVHVLLVDHDMNALFETTRLLHLNSYRVTPVDDASLASSILLSSPGNGSFNLVMVDVSTTDLQGFKLLHEAISMGLPVIVMATNASPTLAKCAIEDGAFLFMQKPTSPEELKYIWQHILRETTRKNKEKGKSCAETSANNRNNQYFRYMYGGDNFEADRTSESVTMNQNMSTDHQKGRLGEINSFGSDSCDIDNPFGACMDSMRPKICTEWTPDLHEKFMAAVKQLGEGKCFPKDILELMNVPGLKRMQVASHLQKCRHGWQPSNGKHGRRPNTSKPPLCKPCTKRYGIFPRGSQPQFLPTDIQLAPPAAPTTSNNESGNLVQQPAGATWDMATAPTNNLNENATGGGQNMLGIDQPLEFGGSDGGLSLRLIANNLNGNEFGYDHSATGQQASDVDHAAIVDPNFWNTWIADFATEA